MDFDVRLNMASPLLFEKLKKVLPLKPWSVWDYGYSLACSSLTIVIISIIVYALFLGSELASRLFESYILFVFGSLLWYVMSYWVFTGFSKSWLRFPFRGVWILFSFILLASQLVNA